jgi:hypothetical protein
VSIIILHLRLNNQKVDALFFQHFIAFIGVEDNEEIINCTLQIATGCLEQFFGTLSGNLTDLNQCIDLRIHIPIFCTKRTLLLLCTHRQELQHQSRRYAAPSSGEFQAEAFEYTKYFSDDIEKWLID